MKKSYILTLVIVLVLSLGLTGAAFAQEEAPTEEPPISTIEGVVIAVDEEAGTVDILQEDGTIVTVAIPEGDYDHPITALLAEYFGGAGLEDYVLALEALEMDGSVVVAVEEGTDEAGNPIWEATLADGSIVQLDDADTAQALLDALEVAAVDLTVTDNEGVLTAEDIGEQIEEYRAMGIGYGELVKIYAIAAESQEACAAEAEDEVAEQTEDGAAEDANTANTGDAAPVIEEPCGVTVDELVAMLLNGADMGELFRLFGKPALLGVGHVRQALDGTADTAAGDGSTGVCNARSRGGKASANGQDITCP
ncbi:MAG: hypothetical protein JXB30_04225 [Anaerolineae bacterium]|nr:hypothetical protein [Anaerolineae bacterium]